MTKWALSQGCKDSSIKPYDYLNRCREILWQNSTSIYDKNSPESRNRRNIPQHKSYIWQTHSKHYRQWWKIESISSKVRNKTRVPTFTIILPGEYYGQKKKKKRILWTEEPGGLQPIASKRVRHDWVTNTQSKGKWPLPWEGHPASTLPLSPMQ